MKALLQLRVPRLGLFQDGDVGFGCFPRLRRSSFSSPVPTSLRPMTCRERKIHTYGDTAVASMVASALQWELPCHSGLGKTEGQLETGSVSGFAVPSVVEAGGAVLEWALLSGIGQVLLPMVEARTLFSCHSPVIVFVTILWRWASLDTLL